MSEENELLRYLWIVRRWLWLILLTTLLAAGAVLAVNLHTAPVYSAAATLLIKPAPSVTNIDYTSALPSERLVRTYIQMIPSPSVLEKVIEQLGLQESPGNLAKRVKVQAVGDTLVVRLSVEDTDPARAALLANTIAPLSRPAGEGRGNWGDFAAGGLAARRKIPSSSPHPRVKRWGGG